MQDDCFTMTQKNVLYCHVQGSGMCIPQPTAAQYKDSADIAFLCYQNNDLTVDS